jgi:transmembrane sensor
MSEKLADRLAHASRHIDAGFDPNDVERGLASLEKRIVVRRRAKQGAIAAAAVTAAVLLSIQWRAREAVPLAAAPSSVQPPASVQQPLTTRDGSVATPLDAQAHLQLISDAPNAVALELLSGQAHFEVTPNPKRSYRVSAGLVEVEVLGTAFEVERRPDSRGSARVHVEHGVVRVRFGRDSATLRAGESGVFPPEVPSQATREVAAAEPEAQPTKPVQREQWRALARAGKHKEAFGSLGKQPVEDLAGLLLAADAARLSGHPREAARYLEHLVQRYPESPSAPLAAFTLGRLSLYELKQPALAAGSFARAYTLDPKGPMAEDALAREAEAYHQAGDAERSKSAAERYLGRFRHGARRKEMARYAAP